MLKIYLKLFILFIICTKVIGQNSDPDAFKVPEATISTDRPGMADTPLLIRKNALQVESGFNYEFNNDNGKKNNSLTYNSTQIRYGISDHFEFRLLSEYIKVTDRPSHNDAVSIIQGINSLSLGSKILITDEQGFIPAVSFLATINLPYFGNKDLKPRFLAPGFRFMAQHSITEKLSFGYNLGAIWDGNEPGSTGLYTVGLDYSLSDKTTVFIENYGFVAKIGQNHHGTNGGICYLIKNNIQFDISAGLGITDKSPDGFFNFGLSWTPSLK